MRSHLQIVQDAGGYREVARTLGLPPDRVRFWERRKSIPPTEWKRISESGLASLDELAAAAAQEAAA